MKRGFCVRIADGAGTHVHAQALHIIRSLRASTTLVSNHALQEQRGCMTQQLPQLPTGCNCLERTLRRSLERSIEGFKQ